MCKLIVENLKNKLFIFIVGKILLFFLLFNTALSNETKGSIHLLFGYDFKYEFNDLSIHSIKELQKLTNYNLDGVSGNHTFRFGINKDLYEYGKVSLSLGYNLRKINASSYEYILINLDSLPIDGEFKHNLNLSISSINFLAEYKYDLMGTSGIGITMGLEMPIASNGEYFQEMTKPEDRGYFTDTGTRIRNNQTLNDTQINSTSISSDLFIYRDFPMDADFNNYLQFRLGIGYNLNNFSAYNDWSIFSIKMSILFHVN